VEAAEAEAEVQKGIPKKQAKEIKNKNNIIII
jgi:hypothetical protein